MSAGTGDKIKGRMEKAAGELTNDQDLKNRGRVNETSGKIKDGIERGVDNVKDALKDDKDRDRSRRP